MGFASAYLLAGSVVLSLMTALWIYSLITKDASIVDRFWGAGFVFLTWAVAIAAPSMSLVQILLVIIVSIWGLRLSLYIHFRNRGHPEDYRYQEMRKHNGARFWWYSYISVFLLQGALMVIVACPVIFVLSFSDNEASGLQVFAVLGAILWLVGFIFESGGDWQLSKFKKNPANKGKLLTKGLWSLTRHPNYFGDACQWWGFGLFAWAYWPLGVLTFIGPIIMTLFIRKVSGVDLLEKSMKGQKPGYEEYMAKVPPFFPKFSLLWSSSLLLCFVAAVGSQKVGASTDYQQELPFSRIDFSVEDLKSGKVIAWGEETLVYEGSTITKSTVYYPPGTERKVIQEETSKVDLPTLEVREYLLSNKESGEKATIGAPSNDAVTVSYQAKPTETPKTMPYKWTPQTLIGKTLHHYIVRQWDKIIAGKSSDFTLLVPMKMDHFTFRTRLDRTEQIEGVKQYVISLEPANWAIRKLVPQMDFNYQMIGGAPRLVSYVGATTITIDGDENRLVKINFSYVKANP